MHYGTTPDPVPAQFTFPLAFRLSFSPTISARSKGYSYFRKGTNAALDVRSGASVTTKRPGRDAAKLEGLWGDGVLWQQDLP